MELDLNTIILALIAGTPAMLMALAALIQAVKTHGLVNSRMSELLEITRQNAAAKATLEAQGVQKLLDAARRRAGDPVAKDPA